MPVLSSCIASKTRILIPNRNPGSHRTVSTGAIVDVVMVSFVKQRHPRCCKRRRSSVDPNGERSLLAKLLTWSSHDWFKSCWIIMVKPHMPQAVVVSCETSVRVLAVLILAQKFATLFDDAVTTRRMTIQILHPIKPL